MNNETTDGVILSIIGKIDSKEKALKIEAIQSKIFALIFEVAGELGLTDFAIKTLLNERSKVGIQKYGTTLQAAEISEREIKFHLLTELLDGAGYSEKWLQIIKNKEHEDVKI